VKLRPSKTFRTTASSANDRRSSEGGVTALPIRGHQAPLPIFSRMPFRMPTMWQSVPILTSDPRWDSPSNVHSIGTRPLAANSTNTSNGNSSRRLHHRPRGSLPRTGTRRRADS
jgi:hypothetical protein